MRGHAASFEKPLQPFDLFYELNVVFRVANIRSTEDNFALLIRYLAMAGAFFDIQSELAHAYFQL